jgi:hypothetical protein
MNTTAMPFEIPAIDNRKAALALYLGLDSENEQAWDSITKTNVPDLADHEPAIVKSASVFQFQNNRFYVSHASTDMDADSVVAFNSNLWKIKKAPASAIEDGVDAASPWPITSPVALPATTRLREAHCYPYLTKAFLPLWLESLGVAHALLDRHEAEHGNETYYQDNFGADYIDALADPQFGSDQFIFDGVTDPALVHLHRNDQPAWQAFKHAQEGLKSAPRGAIAILGNGDRWHIRVHAGEGYICECRTMRSSGPKPSAREIHECLLSSEGYTARCQAREEKKILANFARLRELKLRPGMTIRDVELSHKNRLSKISFKIESITDTGYLQLTDGMLRGSRQRFTASVPACKIVAAQVRANEPKKTVARVDLETAALF